MGVCVVRCVLGLGLNWPGGRGGWVLGWFVLFGLGVGVRVASGGWLLGLGFCVGWGVVLVSEGFGVHCGKTELVMLNGMGLVWVGVVWAWLGRGEEVKVFLDSSMSARVVGGSGE